MGREQKNSKGAHLSLLRQRQNKGNDSIDQGKQNTHEHKDKSCNLENTKRQTHGQTRLCELFSLTVPIEEVARWQYIKQF